MDYEQDDEYEEPFRIHLNLNHLPEEEAKARFSLLYDEETKTMKKRENTDYLRPIYIDGTDVSNKMNHMIRKNMEIFPIDKAIFNMRSISTTLWYFISRGHSAVVFLPTNLRSFAQRCSDPNELSMLAKLELVVFDESTNLHPSSSVLLSKTLATCAQDNDGCIVGSRKKYALLGQKYTEFIDRVTNSLISPSFAPDHELKFDDSVRMTLAVCNF
uniref:RNase_Zc3h12a domain-containing protein n=1 Tax=Caenorhabditis tropicalis TaxID=1561998 RepID=A0A1I7SZK8_9PELO